MTRQRGFKPKSAKSRSARDALDQKAVEALVAAFPVRPGRFPSPRLQPQPETHWSGSLSPSCMTFWCEDCSHGCEWGCCHCDCPCHHGE